MFKENLMGYKNKAIFYSKYSKLFKSLIKFFVIFYQQNFEDFFEH